MKDRIRVVLSSRKGFGRCYRWRRVFRLGRIHRSWICSVGIGMSDIRSMVARVAILLRGKCVMGWLKIEGYGRRGGADDQLQRWSEFGIYDRSVAKAGLEGRDSDLFREYW